MNDDEKRQIDESEKKIRAALADPNIDAAAEEILNAFRQWSKSRMNRDRLNDLGIFVGEPPFTAQMKAVVTLAERIEDSDLDPIVAIGDAVIFGMWLGSRLERLDLARNALGIKKGGD